MSTNLPLSQRFPFPWPPGDPGPEIWSILVELDRGIQLQVVEAVINTHIKQAQAGIAGLKQIQGIVAKAGGGGG
jgi:hypothetical protein